MSGGGGLIIITGKKASGLPTGSKQETLSTSQTVANLLAASSVPAVQAWGADLQTIINEASS